MGWGGVNVGLTLNKDVYGSDDIIRNWTFGPTQQQKLVQRRELP